MKSSAFNNYSSLFDRFMVDRLPEGGEGMHGFDDGEGDD